MLSEEQEHGSFEDEEVKVVCVDGIDDEVIWSSGGGVEGCSFTDS